jgi:hypothetical protein
LCSFDDTTCPGGQRYGIAAGELGGVCVGTALDGGNNGLPGCDLAKPFGRPVLVAGLSSAAEDAGLRLLPDEKTAFFFSTRSGTKLLYTASRSSVTAAFANVSVLANINASDQGDPAISADGLTLFFASLRTGGVGDNDIYQATRNTLTADFKNTRLAANVNTPASEVQPYITQDGTTLYFVRALASGEAVFRATGSVTRGFTNASAISEIDGPTNDDAPVLSADGLTLYWASDRPGGMGDLDIWQAHRPSTSAAFDELAQVSSVNTAGLDAPSDVSEDSCRLYLTSTRAGRTGIYVVTRLP